jgi:cellulose synthase (UDP-forming)
MKDANTFESFMATFLRVQQASDISGSVAVLHGAQFQSFRIGGKVYHVGVLPWWTRRTLWFMEVPWLAAMMALALVFLLALWGRMWLRVRARARLTVHED